MDPLKERLLKMGDDMIHNLGFEHKQVIEFFRAIEEDKLYKAWTIANKVKRMKKNT